MRHALLGDTLHDDDLEPYRELLREPLLHENLERVLELLMEENFAERGCFWMPHRELVYFGDESLRERFPFSRKVIAKVLSRGRGLVSFDPAHDQQIGPSQSLTANDVRSCLCAAAHDQEGVVTAIAYFDNRASEGNFSERDLAFLHSVMALFPKSLVFSPEARATTPEAEPG